MEGIDLRGLDLNLLVALDALLRLGSVTAAARDLGVTQPALSRTLQRLRDTLGDPLLVRVGRGVIPTDRARALAEPLADALRAVQRVFTPPDAFDPRSARGELTIGLGEEAQVAFADAIMGAIWARAPHVDIRVRALTAASLDEGRRGLLDLAIGPDLSPLPSIAGSVDYGDFVAKHLYTRRFVVVSSARNPRRSITLAQYLAAHHVIVGFDGGGRGFVDDLLAAKGHRRRVAATVTSFPGAVNLVANTDLVATVPVELVHASNAGIVASEAPFDLPTLPMLCIWHPRRTSDPRHQFFREVVMRAVIERMG
ncbi:MAG: LysR family transcriptional regulator [Pseudomonadota bacterium]|nr:LysR family transcriptional regulator [Pseudomonadota bacterium]